MKLKSVTIENFRCYERPITVSFEDLTTIVGKNDIGKSTILEALEIFFNNELVKFDLTDVNIHHKESPVRITCDFIDLPESVVLDSGAKTNFESEYLLIAPGVIRICKEFSVGKKSPTVRIIANHPISSDEEGSLLSLKEKDLQKLVKSMNLDCPLKGNPIMRKAIWEARKPLTLVETAIDVTKGDDVKSIWQQVERYLPQFALFQSDRNSSDSDSEVQDPMKAAALAAISELRAEITQIQQKIQDKTLEIALQTQRALQAMNPKLASQLQPRVISPTDSKWASIFSVSLDTDNGIALNKRGSGVRRMVLVAFFKATAEKKIVDAENGNIIYAVEEPETAQHPDNQKILLKAFSDISKSDHAQIILTTHSPQLAQELPIESLRFIRNRDDGQKEILYDESMLSDIAKELGVFPNPEKGIRVIVCVEGPTDVIALAALCRCLREKYTNLVDIANDERVLILPLGGSTLQHWVDAAYLKRMHCPEVHIYDRDVAKYQQSVDRVNARTDGSWAVLTQKTEIENYLNEKAIRDQYQVDVDTEHDEVPKRFGMALQHLNPARYKSCPSDSKSKKMLSKVFEENMTLSYLEEIDPDGEVKTWFEKITELVMTE